jgi:hypothetical protein
MNIKKRIKLLNGIGYTLIAIQVLAFIGSLGKKEEPITDKAELIGYYIGSNLFIIIAIILFLKARSLRKKLKDIEQSALIDSIGEPE